MDISLTHIMCGHTHRHTEQRLTYYQQSQDLSRAKDFDGDHPKACCSVYFEHDGSPKHFDDTESENS